MQLNCTPEWSRDRPPRVDEQLIPTHFQTLAVKEAGSIVCSTAQAEAPRIDSNVPVGSQINADHGISETSEPSQATVVCGRYLNAALMGTASPRCRDLIGKEAQSGDCSWRFEGQR
jgi:hypothetical protein